MAVDIGGTKIAAALVADDGRILRRSSVPTPGGRDADLVADAVLGALADLDATDRITHRVAAVGIGSAGPLDVTAGTVSPVNIPAWRAYPIVELLRTAVPGVPVALAGDGQCMALGEYWQGGAEVRALLGMVVSTGVGGGVVLDGRVQTGPTGSAGHIGHLTVDPDGPRCPCGGRGCVEVYASGPSMVRWAREQGWTPGSSAGVAGADGAGLAAHARAGNPVARAAFDRGARAVAAAIVCAAALVELDEVVLGGGVVNGAADLLLEPIRTGLAAIAGLEFIRRVRIRASTLGAEAGLLGAAALGLAATTPSPARSRE
ncbi:MAG: ROK family protein [Catenulispora sp.]|nr:ROK family protein [Catenulispora sp.]